MNTKIILSEYAKYDDPSKNTYYAEGYADALKMVYNNFPITQQTRDVLNEAYKFLWPAVNNRKEE